MNDIYKNAINYLYQIHDFYLIYKLLIIQKNLIHSIMDSEYIFNDILLISNRFWNILLVFTYYTKHLVSLLCYHILSQVLTKPIPYINYFEFYAIDFGNILFVSSIKLLNTVIAKIKKKKKSGFYEFSPNYLRHNLDKHY